MSYVRDPKSSLQAIAMLPLAYCTWLSVGLGVEKFVGDTPSGYRPTFKSPSTIPLRAPYNIPVDMSFLLVGDPFNRGLALPTVWSVM